MDMMNDTGNIEVLRLDDKVQLFGQYLMQHFPFVSTPGIIVPCRSRGRFSERFCPETHCETEAQGKPEQAYLGIPSNFKHNVVPCAPALSLFQPYDGKHE